MPDRLDQLYDALKADGAVSKSRENFRNYMLAPGEEGYKNRNELYKALKADGAVQSGTYEEFRNKLGIGAAKPGNSRARQQVAGQLERQKAAGAAAQMQPVSVQRPQAPKTNVPDNWGDGSMIMRPEETSLPKPTWQQQPSVSREDVNQEWQESQQAAQREMTHPRDFEATQRAIDRANIADAARKHYRNEYDQQNFAGLYDDVVAPVFKEEREKGNKEAAANTPKLYNQQNPYEVMGHSAYAQIAEEKYTDPERIVSNALKRTQANDAFTDYVYGRMGITTDKQDDDNKEVPQLSQREVDYLQQLFAVENGEVIDKLQQRMYDEYQKEGAPKSTLDYISSKAVHDNFMATVMDALTRRAAHSSGLRQQLRQKAVEEYGKTQSWGTRAVAGAAPFAVDILSGGFAVPNAVGSAVMKGGMKLAAREVEKRAIGRAVQRGISTEAAKRAVAGAGERFLQTQAPILNVALRSMGGAANFATYDAQSELVRQMGDGEFRPVDLLKEAVHGAAIGGAMGVVGGAIGHATRNASRLGKAAADVASIGAETAIFATSGALRKAHDEGISIVDVDWAEQLGESAGMVLGMKGVGAVMHPKTLLARYRKSADFDLKFDRHNLEELRAAGYDMDGLFKGLRAVGDIAPVKSLETVIGAEVTTNPHERANKNVGEEERVDEEAFNAIMQNPEVSSETKRKLYFLATGKILVPEPVFGAQLTENEDGTSQIETFNAQGNRVGLKDYKDAESARAAYAEIESAAKMNSVAALERIAEQTEASRQVSDNGFVMGERNVRPGIIDTARNRTEAEFGVDVQDALLKRGDERTAEENAAVDGYIKNLQEEFIARNNERFARINMEGAERRGYEVGGLESAPKDKQDVRQELLKQEERASRVFDSNEMAELREYPVATLTRLSEEAISDEDKERLQVAIDYVNAQSAYVGMISRVRDDIDSAVQQSGREIDQMANEDGMIVPITMKDDRQAHVISGNVVMLDDGSGIDKAKSDESIIIRDTNGKLEMVAPDAILNIGEVQQAEQAKQAEAERITEEMTEQAGNEIEGTLTFNAGDVYQLEYDGQPHQVEIVQDNGDETVAVRIDGAQEVVPMAKAQLQRMYDQQEQASVANMAAEEEQPAENAAVTQPQVQQEEQQTQAQEQQIEPQEQQTQPAQAQQGGIPVNEQGEPQYEQASPDVTYDTLVGQIGADATAEVARQTISEAQARLKELDSRPIEGATVQEKVASAQAIQQEKAAAQNTIDYWSNVLGVPAVREQALQEAAAQAEDPVVAQQNTEQALEQPVEQPIAAEEVQPVEGVEEPIVAQRETETQAQEQVEPKDKLYEAFEREQGTVDEQGGLVKDEVSDRVLSKGWAGALHAVGRRIGRRIVILSGEETRARYGDKVNGFFDPSDNTLYINEDYAANDENMQSFITGHEVTHILHDENPEVWDSFVRTVRDAMGEDFDSEFAKIRNRYDRFIDRYNADPNHKKKLRKLTDAAVEEEVCCDWAGRHILTDEDAARKIVENAESAGADPVKLTKRILDWVNEWLTKLKEMVKGGSDFAKELDAAEMAKKIWQGMYDVATAKQNQRLENAKKDVDRMVREENVPENTAKEVEQAAEGLEERGAAVDTEKGDVRYAVADVLKGDERKKVIAELMAVTGRSEKTVKKYLQAEESLARVILDGDNVAFLDLQVDESVPSIWNNSDYPQGTVEFSNICRKRLPFTMIYQRLQQEFPNRVFDASTLEDIRRIMKENGADVACGLCFVEDRRQLLGEIGQSFIDAIQGKGEKVNDKQQEALQRLLDSGDSYTPTLYDLLTLDGMKKLRKSHPAVAQAFVEYNNARGMQAGRLFNAYSAYHREILKWNKAKVKSVNDAGGLRIFSFSDFEAHHLIDLVQVLTDCAAKGIKVQGYTKVPEFAKAIKDTKMKLNRSLIAKAKGIVDADYVPQEGEAVSPNVINGKRLLLDTIEGINVNHPDFFDSTDNKNVGNILVGINDEQIQMAMQDPFVDYIIPFHSGLSAEIREKKGIGDWVNYKLSQLEKKENADGKLVNADKHGINIYTDVIPKAEQLIGHPIRNTKDFQLAFFAACNEKGWTPRFAQFINTNKKGEYVYTPGYEKLLIDFKLFDKNGKYAPQEVVQPIFDNEFNAKILNDYVKDEKEKLPIDDLYNKVKEGLGLRFRVDGERSIQGLEGYTEQEIKDIALSEIQSKLEENGIDDVDIKGIAIHGSRGRGTAREDSDLDIVVEYDGNWKEDELFNILNEEPIYIDGIQVDVNPITKGKSGTLVEYMKRSDDYDREVLANQDKFAGDDNTDRKNVQFNIIQQANPRDNELSEHTWINDVSDIKTFDEAFEGYDINEDLTPDYTSAMVKEAKKTGKVKVYSSKEIADGAFVTPSKMEAQNYAGEGKVYSKTVPVGDIAWIDPLQGQYAKADGDIRFALGGEIGAANNTEQQRNLDIAKEMEKGGKDAKSIWLATGWEKGNDNKWRYEIPDAKVKTVDPTKAKSIEDIVDAPELFATYPQLKDYKVKFEKMKGAGSFNHVKKLIRLDADYNLDYVVPEASKEEMKRMEDDFFYNSYPSSARLWNYSKKLRKLYGKPVLSEEGLRTIVHELQHAIQSIEWFAKGGNETNEADIYMRDRAEDEATYVFASKVAAYNTEKALVRLGRAKMIGMLERGMDGFTEDVKPGAAELVDKLKDMTDSEYAAYVKRVKRSVANAKKAGSRNYTNLSGEVEARNVEARMKMSDEERRNTPPSETESVGRGEQIVRFSVAEPVNSKEFKEWFGDSKVVDAEGKPLVVYHGTRYYGFNQFFTDYGLAWFSESAPYAYKYSDTSYFSDEEVEDYGMNGGVYKTYLNLRNPINLGILDDKHGILDPEFDNIARQLGMTPEEVRKACRFGESRNDYVYDLTRTKEFEELIKSKGYDGATAIEGDGVRTYGVVSPTQIKLAEETTYDDNGNPIPASERFNNNTGDIRFSVENANQEVFVSNALRAVDGIKQEKATGEQWLAMLQKNGGLKAGEDKWLGLSDWLKEQASAKHSPTKKEMQDFIREHQIRIEDVKYSEHIDLDNNSNMKQFREEFDDFVEKFKQEKEAVDAEMVGFNDEMYGKYGEGWAGKLSAADKERGDKLQARYNRLTDEDPKELTFNEMVERYGDDFGMAFEVNYGNGKLEPQTDMYGDDLSDVAKHFLEFEEQPINSTRLSYTTKGLENKKEIALTVPTVESWNESDEIHFGDAGGGRAVAWVRFGDTTDADGNRVLVIDEIQSKRHQEGRERGYRTADSPVERRHRATEAMNDYRQKMQEKYGDYFVSDDMSPEEKAEYDRLYQEMKDAMDADNDKNKSYDIPDAPFEKNWHELAMKRMLRLAAEEGYDKIAWTKGEQQAERYDLTKAIPSITRQDTKGAAKKGVRVFAMDINGEHEKFFVNNDGVIVTTTMFVSDADGKRLSDFFGKEMAVRMMAMNDGETIDTSKEKIGGEGMKGFYDEILPRFMNKYGKKWGVKVGEVELPNLEQAGRKMWSVDVTPEMKESVMQGQVMFRVSGELDEQYPTWLSGQTTSTGQHTTQITSTVKTYRRIGDWMEKEGMKDAKVLDASSGLGTGTQALREMGFDVDDVEPYPSKDREAPTFTKYDDINGTYDVVISNAVLNVIPDDWRRDVLHSMADKVKDGGKLIINVRDAKSIENQKQKIELDSPSEILVTDSKGNIRAYQKGFTRPELKKYVEDELGEGWQVDIANESNSGIKSGTAVVATRTSGAQYREGAAETQQQARQESESARQSREAYARRQWRRAKEAAKDWTSKLGLDGIADVYDTIEDVPGNEDFSKKKRRAKGWYDTKTGRIVIVMGNHRSPEDVVQTILHEGVAHHGLRQLFGDRFDTFLDNVYRTATAEVRSRINATLGRNGWNHLKATEEYLARLAENTDFERAMNSGWWDKIKSAFLSMLKELGLRNGGRDGVISDNELRYILWRSYQNLTEPGRYRNPFKAAENTAMEVALNVGNNAAPRIPVDEDRQLDDIAAELGISRNMQDRKAEVSIKERVARMGLKEAQDLFERVNSLMLDEDMLDVDEHVDKAKADWIREHGREGVGTAMVDALNELGAKYGDGMITLRWELMDRIEELGGNDPDNNPGGLRFRVDGEEEGEDEDYDAGQMTFAETVTNGLLNLAEKNRENVQLRTDAMRSIGGHLGKLRQAMARQREYDKATVDRIVRLAKMVMQNGHFDKFSKYEVNRLMSLIKNAAGKEDITKQATAVVDLLMNHQLKEMKLILNSLMKQKTSKVNSSGVEVQAGLDVDGARMVDTFKKAIKLSRESLTELMGNTTDRMASNDEAVADNATVEYMGLQLAQQYFDEIKDSEDEEKLLKEELKTAKEDYEAGRMTREAYKEFEKATRDAIRENRLERTEAYERMIRSFGDGIRESVERAKEYREQEQVRVNEIHHNANSDLQGIPTDEHRQLSWEQKVANWPLVRFFMKPLATFDEMLRFFGSKSVDGKGYLWNRFMGGWTDANDKEWRNVKAAHEELDAKVSEVMGRKMRWSDLFSWERKMETIPVEFWDGDQMKDHELTQGNLLYIYMVNKMADGRMKLRKMGITEEDVEYITDHIDPRFKELADWLQDDFLVRKRNEYNAVHERMFGASMAAIENYFPLKINAKSRGQEVDLNDESYLSDENIGSTITGSIIKRKRNSIALDVTGADAFDVILEHIQNMEHWAAFAEFNRDLNTLLSYKRFRNRVLNMSSPRFGAEKKLWMNFKRTCAIASGAYRSKIDPDSIDTSIVNIAKGVTAAKIAFRIFTAMKQLLSYPAYFSEASVAELAKSTNPVGAAKAWNWAMQNLPGYSKRWQSRQAGDTRLKETDVDWQYWKNKIVETAGRLGMTPNAFVDALTVAMGAKAIYETKYKRYVKAGYSEEDANKKALQDASIAYNETQQSSEGAFTSAMQSDRTVASVALTVFRNASMAYERRLMRALANLKKKMKRGYKEESIEYMTKQMVREGLDENIARASSERAYNRSWIEDIANTAIFGFVMQFAWNLGPYMAYLLAGDDDDEKSDMWTDAAWHALAGGLEGLSGGAQMSEILNLYRQFITEDNKKDAAALKRKLKDYDFNLLPLMSDLQQVMGKVLTGENGALNDVVNLVMQSGIGVNPQTITDAAVAIVDACDGDPETSREAAFLLMRIMQVPQSAIDKLYIDEIGLSAGEAKKLDAGELARRYARYKFNKAAPLTNGFYSDAERKEMEDKYVKRFENMLKGRLSKLDNEDLESSFDTDDDTVRKYAGKEAAKRLGSQDYYGSSTSEYGLIYQRIRSFDDLNEDVQLQIEQRRAKEDGDEDREKEIKSMRNYLTSIKKELVGGNEKEVMEELRRERKKMLREARELRAERRRRD